MSLNGHPKTRSVCKRFKTFKQVGLPPGASAPSQLNCEAIVSVAFKLSKQERSARSRKCGVGPTL